MTPDDIHFTPDGSALLWFSKHDVRRLPLSGQASPETIARFSGLRLHARATGVVWAEAEAGQERACSLYGCRVHVVRARRFTDGVETEVLRSERPFDAVLIGRVPVDRPEVVAFYVGELASLVVHDLAAATTTVIPDVEIARQRWRGIFPAGIVGPLLLSALPAEVGFTLVGFDLESRRVKFKVAVADPQALLGERGADAGAIGLVPDGRAWAHAGDHFYVIDPTTSAVARAPLSLVTKKKTVEWDAAARVLREPDEVWLTIARGSAAYLAKAPLAVLLAAAKPLGS
jgi:hypothetical protein